MREIKIESSIRVLSLDEIKDTGNLELIQAAKDAAELSYSPYSKFKVGCALLLSSGAIVKGANQENASYPICICAEGVTLSTAKTMYPKDSILKMAIYVPSVESPVSPCGHCRQSILEYEHRQNAPMEIFLVGKSEVYVINGIHQILPLAFDGNKLV